VPLLMSAFTPKATIGPQSLHVRSGPIAVPNGSASRHALIAFTQILRRERMQNKVRWYQEAVEGFALLLSICEAVH